jgi:hypothetical protein
MNHKFQNFPAICVDNFYKNPDKVREFALNLSYDSVENLSGTYPGKRTELLHIIEPEFFNKFCKKLFSIYYDFLSPIEWKVSTSFQLIYPMGNDQHDIKNVGWVHADTDTLFAGIIYLTPEINPNCGTSIFNPIKDIDINLFKSLNEKKIAFYSEGDEEEYDKALTMNNSFFNETIRFDNVYNRLVSFDGNCFHKANNFYSENQPRLTQTFFVRTLTSNSKLPLERCYDSEL